VDIYVRKVNGKIVPITGARRLDILLSSSNEVEVTVAGTLTKITVVRDEYGDIVEKRTSQYTE